MAHASIIIAKGNRMNFKITINIMFFFLMAKCMDSVSIAC